MRKIISLFQRNYDTDHLVRNEVVPGAEWVLNGEGIASVKLDGTSCLIQDGQLYKRYDAKKGKTPPLGFIPTQSEPDPVTGHFPGWVLVGDGPDDRWHREAWERNLDVPIRNWTYELVGPKIRGNPYRFTYHQLIRHGIKSNLLTPVPRDFEGLRVFLAQYPIEGIVWWRNPNDPESDLVKIKARDFGLQWPRKEA